MTSDWVRINAGVPQGTLLGPTCFLLHVNDLRPSCPTIKYVDDSTVWEACSGSAGESCIQSCAEEIVEWSRRNRMLINCDKTKEMLVSMGRRTCALSPLTIEETEIERVGEAKLLGVVFSETLGWDAHVRYLCNKASKRLYFLTLLKRAKVSPGDIVNIFVSLVRSVLEYACEVWHAGLTQEQSNVLEQVQRRALRIAYPHLDYERALSAAGLSRLSERREIACRAFFQAMLAPSHRLHHLIPERRTLAHDLRKKTVYPVPNLKFKRTRRSLVNYGLSRFQM